MSKYQQIVTTRETPEADEIGLVVRIAGGGSGGGDVTIISPIPLPVTIADGDDIAEGTTTDAAITSNSPGTVVGFLRGLVTILSDVWDNAANLLRVSVENIVTVTGTLTVPRPGVAATTSVVASDTNVTLLADNALRFGASLYNDSDKKVRVKLGVTASTTSFLKVMFPNEYLEIPFGYTGQIDAIWEALPTGSMRITEVTE